MILEIKDTETNQHWKALIEEGNNAHANGKIPEAETKFLAALQEAEKFGQNDPRLALSLNNLAAIYHEEGKYTMAEPLYKRALDIHLSISQEIHPDTALVNHNLAVLYSARKMYPLAEKHYQKALHIKESLFGKNNPELLNTLIYYAQLMKVQNLLVEQQLLQSKIKEISQT